MSIKILDLSSLHNAILQLEDSLSCYQSDVVLKDSRLIIHMRAAIIQAFEFTYELSWKMLKRYLEMTEPDPSAIDKLSFPDLIRIGCEKNLLLSDLKIWKKYREHRSITSHTYDKKKAEAIVEFVPNFLKDAQYLLARLEERKKLS